jgi:hypothetical protein
MQTFVNIPVHPETRDTLRPFVAWLRKRKARSHINVSYDYAIWVILNCPDEYSQYWQEQVDGAIGAPEETAINEAIFMPANGKAIRFVREPKGGES